VGGGGSLPGVHCDAGGAAASGGAALDARFRWDARGGVRFVAKVRQMSLYGTSCKKHRSFLYHDE
jgi:hypothetical protein